MAWSAMGGVADAGLANVDPDSIPSMYDEATHGVPPKGPYLAVLRRLEATETREAKQPMLKMVFNIAEPKGTRKAKYNGYSIWFYRTIGKEQASRVNAFLHALLDGKTAPQRKKIIEAFWANKISVNDDGMIVKIGTWNVPDEIPMGINTRLGDYNGPRLEVSSVMPASDAPKGVPELDEADTDDDDPDAAQGAGPQDDDEEPDGEGEDEAEMSEEEQARYDELAALTLAKLKAEARKANVTVTGDKESIINAILDAEFAADEDEEDEDEPDEEEEEPDEDEPEGDEFDEMDRAALKKALKANGIEFRVTTKTTDDEIREALRAEPPADEEEDEEEDEEPEPPAKPTARAKSPGRPAARRRRSSAETDEPPF
jgi:hypothetical protein